MVYTEQQLDNIKTCLPSRYSGILAKRIMEKHGIKKRNDVIRRSLMPKFQNDFIIKEAIWLAKKHNPVLFEKFKTQWKLQR